MEENLFVYVDCFPAVHVASRFFVRKNVAKANDVSKTTTTATTAKPRKSKT